MRIESLVYSNTFTLIYVKVQDGVIDELKNSYCVEPICTEPIVNLRSCITYNMTMTAYQFETNLSGETETYLPIVFKTLEQGKIF